MSHIEIRTKVNALLAELTPTDCLQVLREIAEHKSEQIRKRLDALREEEVELVEAHDELVSFAHPNPPQYSVID